MSNPQEEIPDSKQQKGALGANIKKKIDNPKGKKTAGKRVTPTTSKTSVSKIPSKASNPAIETIPGPNKTSSTAAGVGSKGITSATSKSGEAVGKTAAKPSTANITEAAKPGQKAGSGTSATKGTTGIPKPSSSTTGRNPPAAKTSGTGINKKPSASKIPKSTAGGSKKSVSSAQRSNASIKKDSGGGPPSQEPSATKIKSISSPANDVLNTEFIYYSAVLRNYALILTREYDKVTTHLWMKKLFKPEYHSTVLKPKRNKYLLYLAITIYNDEAYGIFCGEPPRGVLPEINNIPFNRDFPPAAWELEKQWAETIVDLPEDLKISYCYLHENGCPQPKDNLKSVLDTSFQFYLWLVRPYVALLTDMEDKTMVACWIQLLCGIAADENDCVEMKELRNEYMQALIGYVHDLRVEGPFRLMPPVGPIPPLSALYDACDDGSNKSAKTAEEFLKKQPVPDNGAFAYINVTGELFGTI